MRLEQLKFGKPRWILLEIREVTHKQGHGVNSDTSVGRQLMKYLLSVWLGIKENIRMAISSTLRKPGMHEYMIYMLAHWATVCLLWQSLEEMGPMLSSFN